MPRRRVTAAQLLVVAIEKYQLDGNAFLALQTVDRGEAGIDAEIARSDIDADGKLMADCAASVASRRKQPRQQPKRQVVDALETQILEGFQSGRLSGAGHAGDQQDALSRRVVALQAQQANQRITSLPGVRSGFRSCDPDYSARCDADDKAQLWRRPMRSSGTNGKSWHGDAENLDVLGNRHPLDLAGRHEIDAGDERRRAVSPAGERCRYLVPPAARATEAAPLRPVVRPLPPHRYNHPQPGTRPHRSAAAPNPTCRTPTGRAATRRIPRPQCRFRANAPWRSNV